MKTAGLDLQKLSDLMVAIKTMSHCEKRHTHKDRTHELPDGRRLCTWCAAIELAREQVERGKDRGQHQRGRQPRRKRGRVEDPQDFGDRRHGVL